MQTQRRRKGPWRRSIVAFSTVVASIAAAAMTWTLAAGAVAPYVDLTTAGATATINGAIVTQGVGPAGTGNFDPFLTLSTNQTTEAGWNSNSAPSGDAFYGGSRTHVLSVAAVPTETVNGVAYRELSLDGNDQGSDDWMSIDDLRLFYDDQSDLKGFDPATNTFSTDNATKAVKFWDLGGSVLLLRTQALSSGSGQSDLTVLVPNSLFPAECYYGSTTCNKYLIVYNADGGAGTSPGDGHNYDVTAGFEEWRTRLAPVVNVAKTATPSFTRTYDWTVKKYVSLDNSTWQDASVALNLFNGQSSTVYWKITPTRSAGTDSGWTVGGSVTVTNPTGGTVIASSIPATINSLTDVIKRTGLADLPVTLSCPVSFPYTLGAGATLTCTYTKAVGSGDAGTNRATAVLSTGDSFSGEAAFSFSSVTPTEKYATASLGDTNSGSLGAVTSGVDVAYTTTAGCGSSGTILNTATLTAAGSPNLVRTDPASVVKTCYGLNVTKTATPAFTKTYHWTVKKYVSLTSASGPWEDASLNLSQFNGDAKTVYWKVVPTRDAGTDSGFGVTGTITVANPAPIAATGVSVADSIFNVGAATVDCDPLTAGNQTTVNIPASSSVSCAYTSPLPDGTTRLNTATASLAGQDYTGTASINFSGVQPSEVDENATLDDDLNSGFPAAASSGTAVYYSTTAACGVDGTITNTAVVKGTDTNTTASDAAAVNMDCLQLTVTKTATPSFKRVWTWTVDKSATNSALTLALGETYLQPYSVVYTATKADSEWKVSGSITVTSPAGAPTRTVNVTDVYAGTNATVDCNGATAGSGLPASLAGGSSLNCTYEVSLASAANGNNVATATMTNVPSGTTDFVSDPAGVTFTNPTTEIDESIAVTDTVPAGSYCTGAGTPNSGCTAGMVGTGPPSGTVLASQSPKTFTYTRIIGPYTSGQCGTQNVDNTADLTTNDTSTKLSDSVRIVVTIPCPTGCTLTQGYWKTHSILGPAPFDDAWNNIPESPYAPASTGTAEQLAFFYSGQTWYQMFWTAPKGGNAYYILGHQYAAAVLNVLNGADPSAITTALNDALALLNVPTATPDTIGKLKGTDATRAQWINLAGILGSYNEGKIGPGHCDEDSTRSTTD